ncbi:MAG: hypothetical protein LC800_17425 [Acidobacteria bacterium]|nr:hypothetical protein [Acidobacteriota bacterium]
MTATRKQFALALAGFSLFVGGPVSVVVPFVLLWKRVRSGLVWNVFAPGWRLVRFGRDDLPRIVLAFTLDALLYSAAIFALAYACALALRKIRYE